MQFRGGTRAEMTRWLEQILKRKLIDVARQYRHAQKRNVQTEVSLETLSQAQLGACLECQNSTPSKHLIAEERDDALFEAIGRLPADYRNVMLWHHRDKFSFEDIGRRLGKSAEAVRKLWSRSLTRLKQELATEG